MKKIHVRIFWNGSAHKLEYGDMETELQCMVQRKANIMRIV